MRPKLSIKPNRGNLTSLCHRTLFGTQLSWRWRCRRRHDPLDAVSGRFSHALIDHQAMTERTLGVGNTTLLVAPISFFSIRLPHSDVHPEPFPAKPAVTTHVASGSGAP